MGRDDVFSNDIDWLDVGPEGVSGETPPPRRPWPKWFTLAVVVTVVALAVAALNRERGTPSAARPSVAPTTSATSSPAAPQTSSTPTSSAFTPKVQVTELGHPLLGVTAGWELFGRGENVMVRIQFAAGRITLTDVPSLLSGGPASLLAGKDRVLVRPLDNVPGYVVPDGKPGRELSLLGNQGSPVYPGPAPDQMWIQPSDDHEPVMALATLDGRRLADFIPIPDESSSFEAVPDGAGYLLFPGVGGVYDARPAGLRRITTGALRAVGPTGWLVVECDARHRCQTVLIGRADGSRRVVPAQVAVSGTRGVLSPDGATAAMLTGTNGVIGLYLLDLVSGGRRVINLAIRPDGFDSGSNLAFSPDGKWLVTVTEPGEISVINRRTGAVSALGTPLPAISQIVVRPAG